MSNDGPESLGKLNYVQGALLFKEKVLGLLKSGLSDLKCGIPSARNVPFFPLFPGGVASAPFPLQGDGLFPLTPQTSPVPCLSPLVHGHSATVQVTMMPELNAMRETVPQAVMGDQLSGEYGLSGWLLIQKATCMAPLGCAPSSLVKRLPTGAPFPRNGGIWAAELLHSSLSILGK